MGLQSNHFDNCIQDYGSPLYSGYYVHKHQDKDLCISDWNTLDLIYSQN